MYDSAGLLVSFFLKDLIDIREVLCTFFCSLFSSDWQGNTICSYKTSHVTSCRNNTGNWLFTFENPVLITLLKFLQTKNNPLGRDCICNHMIHQSVSNSLYDSFLFFNSQIRSGR